MTTPNILDVTSIGFPNTAKDEDKCFYTNKANHRFDLIQKQGEMFPINWILVSKDNKKVAEIKESICDLYFNEQ